MSHSLPGERHCGAVRMQFDPGKPVSELLLRACQCGVCRRHGALTTSDPAARLHIEAAPGAIKHYSFCLGVTDVLLCAERGTYVGANLPGFEDRAPAPMVYHDEPAEERLARRKARRMPAVLTEAQPNA